MSDKRIIINGRFLVHRITGTARYCREIVNELDKLLPHGEWEMAVPPDVETLPEYENINVVRVGRMKNIVWEHTSFPRYVHSRNGISLNLGNVGPLVSPGIVCIHDAIIKRMPQTCSWKFLLWYNILHRNTTRRAKMLITVSEFSKREICACWRVAPPQSVIVAYNASQHCSRINFDENALTEYGLNKHQYFFAISSLAANKNFKWIAEVAANNPDQTFAIAGGMNSRVFSDASTFPCPDNLKFLGYVSDEQAKTLMRDCKAFLFPSLYEGFGIPPLEAIANDAKHIVLSDIPVLREVYPRGAYFIDPNDSRSFNLEGIMKQEITDSDREFYMDKYSWRKSAETILRAINEHVLSAQ